MKRKIKAMIDAALESGDHIIFCGGRGYQKKLIQNYIFMKQFPKGKVAIVSSDGIRASEQADYKEIETKLKQAEKVVAESFARIIRGNLSMIDKSVQDKFEQLYTDVTGEKMYKGFKD